MTDKLREVLEAHDLRRWTRMVKLGGGFDHLRCYCGEKIFEDSNDAMFGHVAAALAISEPSDLQAKLEALRDELYNGETLSRVESSEDSTPEDAYSEGSQAAEKRVRARLTAILEGKS